MCMLINPKAAWKKFRFIRKLPYSHHRDDVIGSHCFEAWRLFFLYLVALWCWWRFSVNNGYGNSKCCIVRNWTFLKTFHLSSKRVLQLWLTQPAFKWVAKNRWAQVWMAEKCLGRLVQVFSCVGSFWNSGDSVCSDSTCKVWEGWLLAVGAIGYSEWLCASCMTILIGGVLANQRGVWEGWNTACALFSVHSVPSFPILMFWSTGMRLAPPAVKEAYCISRKHRTYALLWSWQHVEAVCSVQLFCRTGQTRGNGMVVWRQLAIGLSLGGVWGPLKLSGEKSQYCIVAGW